MLGFGGTPVNEFQGSKQAAHFGGIGLGLPPLYGYFAIAISIPTRPNQRGIQDCSLHNPIQPPGKQQATRGRGRRDRTDPGHCRMLELQPQYRPCPENIRHISSGIQAPGLGLEGPR